jgi:hypothetical protein
MPKDPASAVVPYSYELEAAQLRQPPFLARFERDDRLLLFVAARHGCDPDTFRLIDEAFATHRIRLAIIEGYPAARGMNPPDFLRQLPEWRAQGFCRGGGEPAYTAFRAQEHGAAFVGGEPEEPAVARAVLEHGFAADDLLGFYFVRQVPQFRRDGTLSDKGLDASFRRTIDALGGAAGLRDAAGAFTLDRFGRWYQGRQGKEFDPATMDSEEAAPLATGAYFTQRLSAVVGLVRDRFTVRRIASHLASEKAVLVVYGGSHFPTLAPALEILLGEPRLSGGSNAGPS